MSAYNECMDFLGSLVGDVSYDTNLYYLVWTLDRKTQKKVSKFVKFDETGEHIVRATDYIFARAQEPATDIYIGCGLHSKELKSSARGCAKDIAGITALWIDLDVGKHDSGKVYPPTVEDAQKVIDAMPVKPTMTVHTGNGLHLWYCFKEPWIFEDDADRARAAAIVAAWQKLAMAEAKRLGGWSIDSTHDLARVLRIPGTQNRKQWKTASKPVHVIERDDERRYNPDELAEMVAEVMPQEVEPEPVAPAIVEQAGNDAPLYVDPSEKLRWIDRMREIDENINLAWRAKRKDLSDTLLSGQIASFICQVYTENAREDCMRFAIEEFYRLRGEDAIKQRKGARKDIQDGIINGARRLFLERQKNDKLSSCNAHVAAARDDGRDAVEAAAKEVAPKMLNAISDMIGTKVLAIKRYMTEPSTFVVETNMGACELGTTEAMMNKAKFHAKLIEITQNVFDLKKKEHHALVQSIIYAAQTVELGAEATEAGVLRGVVKSWIESSVIFDDADSAMEEDAFQRPFWHKGRVAFRLDRLLDHLSRMHFRREPKDIPKDLKKAGFDRDGVKVTDKKKGKRTERSVWLCPVDFVLDDEAVERAASNPWNAARYDQ